MDVRKLVGGNVARLRKAKGIKQEPFSVAAGVTQSYLSQIENGHVNLTLLGLHELAQALSVEPGELFRPIESEQNSEDEARPPTAA